MVQALESIKDGGFASDNIASFAKTFASFANGSSDEATAGVSFAELRGVIHSSLNDPALLAKTKQRIANYQMAAQKAQETAEKEQAAQEQAAQKEETKDAPAQSNE